MPTASIREVRALVAVLARAFQEALRRSTQAGPCDSGGEATRPPTPGTPQAAGKLVRHYELIEEDSGGTLQLTDRGRDFLNHQLGQAESLLDTREGLIELLTIVGDGASLADWFGTCCKLSDAERLRWFLREAQLYCQHHFGDSTMTDTEARYIREFLDENPRHLHAAFAVARAWPAVKHDVCRRFLEHLRDRVEERVREAFPEIADDLDIGYHYGGDKNWSNYLRIYRYGWVRWEDVSGPRSDGRTAVMLECGTGGPMSLALGCALSDEQDQHDRAREGTPPANRSRAESKRPLPGRWSALAQHSKAAPPGLERHRP